jgi:hypothetical protein
MGSKIDFYMLKGEIYMLEDKNALKSKYNKLLKRYKKGIIYLGNHRDEIGKYIVEIKNIMDGLSDVISELAEKHGYVMTNYEIENGFEEE